MAHAPTQESAVLSRDGREYRLDFLRAMAIIGVLVIHSVGRGDRSDKLIYDVSAWLDLFSRPCIAMFLFIAGYWFHELPAASFLWKRVKRALVPYLVFSCLALMARYMMPGQGRLTLGDAAVSLLIGDTWPIYYFVFVIILVYVLAWLFLQWSAVRDFLGLAVIFLFALNLIHAASYGDVLRKLGFTDADSMYKYRAILNWLPYFFLGLYCKRRGLQPFISEQRWAIRGAWLMIFGIYNLLTYWPNGGAYYDGYASVMGTVYSTAWIFMLLTIDARASIFRFLSETSYLIYLSHIFFVYALVKLLEIKHISLPFMVGFPLIFAASLLGAIGVFWLGRAVLGARSRMIIGA